MSERAAAVYLRAAKLIDNRDTTRACWAISLASRYVGKYREKYVDGILEGNIFSCYLYPSKEYGRNGCDAPAAMDARVIALCFAAAMAEAGDL